MSWRSSRISSDSLVRFIRIALIVIAALLVLYVLVASAPAFHWLWYGVFWRHPTFWALILIWAIGSFWLTYAWREEHIGSAMLVVSVALVVGTIVYGIWASARTMYVFARDIKPEVMSGLLDTTGIRWLPMEVAERFGVNKSQDPLTHLGDIDPLIDARSGDINWVAPRIPSGWWNTLNKRTNGFAVVKADGSVNIIPQLLKFGEGMYFSDHISWPLWQENYLADLTEVYYLQNGDEVLAMVPYILYRFSFPVRVPYWGGVFVVHGDGQIENLSPKQAQADSRFVGQRLYPEALARYAAEAWAFRNGIANAWFTHRDQVEVPKIEGAENQMPYLIPTALGPQWFIACEPYGPAYGIFKAIYVDARTGQVRLMEFPVDSSLVGPNRAMSYARTAFPEFNWFTQGDKESYGRIITLEPRPVIRSGRLYWMVSITSVDFAGVSRTLLIDASNDSKAGSTRYFLSPDELKLFLAGKFEGYLPSGEAPRATSVSAPADISKLTNQQLIELLKSVAAELEKRQSTTK